MNEINALQVEISIIKIFEYMLENNCNRKAACKALGVSYSTFNKKLAEDSTVLASFLERQKATLSLNLSQVILAQQEVLKNIISQASNPDLSLAEKLTLSNFLAKMQEGLRRNLGVETEQERTAKDFLRGASLTPGITKVTKIETVTEFEMQIQELDNLDPGIIDVEELNTN